MLAGYSSVHCLLSQEFKRNFYHIIQTGLKYKEFVAPACEIALTREEETVSLLYFEKPARSLEEGPRLVSQGRGKET